MTRLASLAALVLGATALSAADPVAPKPPAAPFFFQPGDRVLFLGDSITEQYQYSTDIELYLTTRYPAGKFVFLNAGIGGDTASGGANRFQAHVLDEKPTKVTINFGMNDGGYGAFKPEAAKNFDLKTRQMLEAAKKAGVAVALVSPNAVDPRKKTNGAQYLETQKQFYAPLKAAAEEFKIPFADQYAVTRAAQEKMAKDDPQAKTAVPYPDGFHTAEPGGLLMAHSILTQLNAPAEVSYAEFSAELAPVSVRNCKVSGNSTDGGSLKFTRTDDALPMPLLPAWKSMLPYTDNLSNLNYYGLKVAGLSAGKYEVKCDGQPVARYTAEELAAGVNLGLATAGPVFQQGEAVYKAIQSKNQLVHKRFREVVMYNTQPLPAWLDEGKAMSSRIAEAKKAELAKRLAVIEEKQAAVWELAKPKSHVWTVEALK